MTGKAEKPCNDKKRTSILTRSSAQGNCTAKSLVASVMSSILTLFINSSLSSLSSNSHACHRKGLMVGGRGSLAGGVQQGEGGLAGGGGQGTFQSSYHILHYHMVLRPKGTSHNETNFHNAFGFSNARNLNCD